MGLGAPPFQVPILVPVLESGSQSQASSELEARFGAVQKGCFGQVNRRLFTVHDVIVVARVDVSRILAAWKSSVDGATCMLAAQAASNLSGQPDPMKQGVATTA